MGWGGSIFQLQHDRINLTQTCAPNGHLRRVTYKYTRCRIDTINSPDDGPRPVENRNKYMKKNCTSSWLFTKVKVILIIVAVEFLNLTPELLQGVCCALRPLFCPYVGDSRSFEKGKTQNMLSYNTSYSRSNNIHCQRCENIKSYNVVLLSKQMF
jgi:hypothetical protein